MRASLGGASGAWFSGTWRKGLQRERRETRQGSPGHRLDPDGRLIRAYGDGIYDPASGKTVVTKGWPQDCAGTLAVVDDLGGTLRVLDCRTGQLKFTLPYGPSKAFFSPDGKRLAVGTETELVVYDTTSWKPVARFP